MCKRVWMNTNDFVIVMINKETNELKGEVQYKYELSEVSKLEKQGEINLTKFQLSTDIFNNMDNNDIIFGDDDEDDENEGDSPTNQGLADLDNNNMDLDDEFNIDDI